MYTHIIISAACESITRKVSNNKQNLNVPHFESLQNILYTTLYSRKFRDFYEFI